MKKTFSILALALMVTPSVVSAKVKKKELPTIDIITKVNDHWQATHSPKVRAFWDDAAYFTGNMEAYKLTGKASYLEYSDQWARHNEWCGAREQDPTKWKYKTYGEGQDYVLFGDWQICFQTYLDMYAMNPNPYKIARAKEVMTRECLMPANDFWWWADALYMVMPVMTKMYKATGDEMFLDKLYDNFMFADNLMYDKEAHLYYRDGKYIYPKHKSYNGKKDFWARGDGWVLAGLAKVLTDMPADYKHRPFFEQRFCELAKAVAECQQKQGYWTRSMLDADHADGPETSGTAFFTYGLLWGMNHGLLDVSIYKPVVDKAWNYLVGTALQADGSVGYVQPIGEKAIRGQKLTAGNTANFGTGAFLLAACEKLRFDENSVWPTKDSKTVQVTVSNPTDQLRNEVVELDASTVFSKLGISGGRQFKVLNSIGQEVPYQLTHDGKLLVEASTRPGCSAHFTIKKGVPQLFPNICYGRQYPERLDDIAWENDRAAYRCYGPALQRRGEKSFGYDIWSKNTPDLECEERYYTETVMNRRANKLRPTNKAAADSVIQSMSYHLDHGNGLDAYAVGPTLGCGTPAVLGEDGNIIMPYCYRDYRILDNGPLRFTVELTYNPVTLNGDTAVVEHRLVSLDKGSNFNKAEVWYEGLTKNIDFVSGIVIHKADTKSVELGSNYVMYADPTDRPTDHNFQIFLSVVFPKGGVSTKLQMLDKAQGDYVGHALCVDKEAKPTDRHEYYFGSAWSKYDCRSFGEWKLRTEALAEALATPLSVTLE